MRIGFGKKAMDIPLHWLIIFVVLLIIMIIMAVSGYRKSDGLLGGLFSSMRGG